MVNNATTEIPPDIKNRLQKGSGPNLGSSTKLMGEEQLEEESSCVSNRWTSPLSLRGLLPKCLKPMKSPLETPLTQKQKCSKSKLKLVNY